MSKKNNNKKIEYYYPEPGDEDISYKIYKKREFQYHRINKRKKMETYEDIKKYRDNICKVDFKPRQQQAILTNLLNPDSPLTGILVMHGTGTGKTCSAISIAEETRQYMKEMGINSSTNNSNKRIIIVCSQNVQANFKKQLFDENKLEFVNNRWTINNCAGINLLDEINMLKQNNYIKAWDKK